MNEVVLPRKKINFSGEEEVEDMELPLMEFEAVVTATEHFSDFNKVGKGGFGVVYKVKIMKESLWILFLSKRNHYE